MSEELKPCPFCGEVPDLPSGDGTQYEIECGNCAMAMASVQICDLMTGEERSAEKFTNDRYSEQYVERAKAEAIKQWNTRATLSPAHIEDGEEVEVVGHLALDEPFNGAEGLEIGEWEFVPERSAVESMLAVSTGEMVPLMTVAQHQRIVAALSADNQRVVPPEPILAAPHPMAALSAPPAAGVAEAQSKAAPEQELAGFLYRVDETVVIQPVENLHVVDGMAVYTNTDQSEMEQLRAENARLLSAGQALEAEFSSYRREAEHKYGAPTPPASEQQQTVPRHKFEGLVEEVRLKDAEIARLAEQVMNLQAYRDGESGDGVWYWQGDGEDHLESLTCPIVIRPQDLRRLVASEQQRAVVMPEFMASADDFAERLHAAGWRAEADAQHAGMRELYAELLRLNPHLAKG